MREFGDLGCIVVNRRTGNVVGGHQRLKHLDPNTRIESHPHKDPAGTVALGHINAPGGMIKYREVDWPESKEKAANLAANKHGGEFDEQGVASILGELQPLGMDLDLTGFLADERYMLLGPEKQTKDPDSAPSVAAGRPTAKPGELWKLGEHRVLCGDATKIKDWQKLFAGANKFASADKAAMIFTDPPYGVDYEGHDKVWDKIKNDGRSQDDKLHSLLTHALTWACKNSADEAAFYIWHASSTRDDFAQALRDAGLQERQYLIWAKPGILIGHADYNWAHEPCFYAAKAGCKPAFHGDRTQSTCWRVAFAESTKVGTVIGPGILILDGKGGTLYAQSKAPKGRKLRQIRLNEKQSAILAAADEARGTLWEVGKDHGYEHPTQKPVELARRAIENSSRVGETVTDPFLGSGSTLIAAEITGRRCYGMELEPKYVDVIVARWEKFTGRKAVKPA